MQVLKTVFFIAFLSFFIACNNANNNPTDISNTEEVIDTQAVNAAYDKGVLVAELDLVKANNSFAFDLMKKVTISGENLVFSPYSISTALAMTYAGAQQETEVEMRQGLRFPENNTQGLHQAFSELNKKINNNCQGSIQLSIANKIWTLENFVTKDGFNALSKGYYKTEVGKFANPSDGVSKINQWVAQQTQDKIQDILKDGDFDESTKMALVNAIYFNGNWETQFEKNNTHEDSFKVNNTTKVAAFFMNGKVDCKVADYEQYHVVELFYKNRKASILIALPNETISLDSLLKTLTIDSYLDWNSKLVESSISITIPKFKITPPTLPLKEILMTGFNIKTPFGQGESKPNFSKMSDEEIQIGNVVHKAFIEVNETGTEAAAATVVTMTKEAASLPFYVNRPFLYIIRDNATNSILFMGQVCNPK